MWSKMIKNLKLILFILSLFILPACATLEEMDEGLNALIGQDYHTAFNILGYPSDVEKFDDTTLYIWTNNSADPVSLPQKSFNRGDANDKFYKGSSTSNKHNLPHQCTVQLAVAPDGKIIRYHTRGALAACRIYLAQLNAYLARQI